MEYDLIPWRLEGKGLAWRWKGEAPAAFDPGVQSSLLSWMISLSLALAAPSGTDFWVGTCLTETCGEESLPHSENRRYNTRKFQGGCILLRLYENKAGYLCIYGILIYVTQTMGKTVLQQKTGFWSLQVLWISIPLLLSLSFFSWQGLSGIWAATSVHHFK